MYIHICIHTHKEGREREREINTFICLPIMTIMITFMAIIISSSSSSSRLFGWLLV